MIADDTAVPGAPWPELDCRFLASDRRPVPAFPLDVFPGGWQAWVEAHAQAAACPDYVAQALLAAVSAVCGSRFVVEVTPHWREPLVLWQALVGSSSTGKTPAMVAARRLLASVTAPADPAPEDELLTAWMVYRGLASWCDDLEGWLEAMSRNRDERICLFHAWTGEPSHSDGNLFDVGREGLRLPKSIFGACRADRLAQALGRIDEAVAARFLYCWPEPRLDALVKRANDADRTSRSLMQRLTDLPGTREQPATISLSEAAVDRLQALLPRLRTLMRDAEGLQAAWIGKAAGNILRLAGLLCLMDWAEGDSREPCAMVDEPQLERAHALWADYYWPHAQAVFGEAPATLTERRVQRVGRWLRRARPHTISREEVRREGLNQSVDADTAESVIDRLERKGVLRMLDLPAGRGGGPRRRR